MVSRGLRDVGVRAVVENAQGYVSDLRKMGDAEAKSNQRIQQLTQRARTAGLALSAFGASAAALGFVLVRAASDVEEMDSRFRVVFGDLADQAEEWATSLARDVNRSRFELMGFMASLQDLFVPLGFTRDRAFQLSRELTALAIDVASFNNEADATVIRAFQSALVGNTETVRRYGIVITEASLEQEILNSGMRSHRSEITELDKVQARFNLIVAASGDAIGDAARTSESFANQMRGLQATVRDVQVEMGQDLLPAANALVGALRQVLEVAGDIPPELRQLVVVSGAVAGGFAAIAGPGLLMVSFLPRMAAGLALVRTAALGLAVGPAAPLVVTLTVVGLLAAALAPRLIDNMRAAREETDRWSSSLSQLSQQELNAMKLEIDEQIKQMETLGGTLDGLRRNYGNVFMFQSELDDLRERSQTINSAINQQMQEEIELRQELAATQEEQQRTLEIPQEAIDAAREFLELQREQNEQSMENRRVAREANQRLQEQQNTLRTLAVVVRGGERVLAQYTSGQISAREAIELLNLQMEVQNRLQEEQQEFLTDSERQWRSLLRTLDPVDRQFRNLNLSTGETIQVISELSGLSLPQLRAILEQNGLTLQDFMNDITQYIALTGVTVDSIDDEVRARQRAIDALREQQQEERNLANLVGRNLGPGANIVSPVGIQNFYRQLEIQASSEGLSGVPVSLDDFARSVQRFVDDMGGDVGGGLQAAFLQVLRIIQGLGEQVRAGVDVPNFQEGGTMRQAGHAIVGERGPEILSLPAGAVVTPVSNNNTFNVTAHYTNPQEPQDLRHDLEVITLMAGV